MIERKQPQPAPPSPRRTAVKTETLDADMRERLEAPAKERSKPLGVPSVLGDRFELQELLGEGGMAVVYRAFDRLSGEAVAVKVLRGRNGNDGVRRAERFRRELRAARSVTHPGVVRIHELFEFDKHLALSMQLVDGETLEARLGRQWVLPPEAVVRLAHELAEGLACAHAQGVVHRDLKPSNILLRSDDGRAMISDFGISVVSELPTDCDSAPSKTSGVSKMTGGLLGTPAYMAPEQLVDAASVDARTDIYALGLVLFEASTGRLPDFDVELRNGSAVRVEPPRNAFPPEVPRWLVDVILRCLQHSPSARFADGAEFAAAVRAGDKKASWFGPRRLSLMALAAVLALAAFLATHSSSRLPTSHRRAYVEVTAAPGVSETVRRATERLLRKNLAGRASRFEVALNASQANVRIVLHLHVQDGAVWLDPSWGPMTGQLTKGAPIRGASVVAALDELGPSLSEVLSADQSLRAPSPDELRAMKKFGLTTLDQLHVYEEAVDGLSAHSSGPGTVGQTTKALLKIAPNWARTHVLAEIARRDMSVTGLPAELPPLDRSRDPQGVRLLDSVRSFYADGADVAVQQQQALYRESPDDLLFGIIYASTVGIAHRLQEQVAVLRALHARFPHLVFGTWLIGTLPAIGREAEVPTIVERWLERAPEGEGLIAAIGLRARTPGAPDVTPLVDAYVQLYGPADPGMATLADAFIASGRLGQATELSELQLASGDKLARLLARRRLGDIALLQGRFAAGQELLEISDDTLEGSLDLAGRLDRFSTLLGMAEVLGDSQAAAAYSLEVGRTLRVHGNVSLHVLFDRILSQPGKECDSLSALTELAPEAQAVVLPHAQRYLASRGCGGCARVVKGGFLVNEISQASLHAFGECALEVGDARLAVEAFRRLSVVQTGTVQTIETLPSPVHAVLAWYGLGRAQEALGDIAAARDAYEHFLTQWKGADRPLPQLEDARRRLTALRAGPASAIPRP